MYTELKYALWTDNAYQELLKKIQNEHQKFCVNLNMSEDETVQAMVKKRWETLMSLKFLIICASLDAIQLYDIICV